MASAAGFVVFCTRAADTHTVSPDLSVHWAREALLSGRVLLEPCLVKPSVRLRREREVRGTWQRGELEVRRQRGAMEVRGEGLRGHVRGQLYHQWPAGQSFMQIRLYLWATRGNEPGHCVAIPEQTHHSTRLSPRGQAVATGGGVVEETGDWRLCVWTACLTAVFFCYWDRTSRTHTFYILHKYQCQLLAKARGRQASTELNDLKHENLY